MTIVLPLSHLDLEVSDNSWLLRVDGRPVDLAGYLSEKYTALIRECRAVIKVLPSEPPHADVLTAIQRYSPPDSSSAQIVQLLQQDQWFLAQVRFSTLQDAVVVLKTKAQGVEIVHGGVWSGSTHPHRPASVIRRYLKTAVPPAPAELTDCFELQT